MGPRRAGRRRSWTGCAACRPSAGSGAGDDHAGARRPRLARLADPRLRPGPGRQRHLRARRGHRCPRHLRRPHPRPRGPRPGLEGDRQRRQRGLRLRRRPDGLVGDGDRGRRRRVRRDPADRVRRAGRRQRDLASAACRATCTAPRRSARGSWSDDLGLAGASAARRRHRHGRRSRRSAATCASTWDGLVAGRSGVGRITQFDAVAARASQIAAEVKDFDPSGVLDRKEMRRTDRYIQFALVCARQALDAGRAARPSRRRPRRPDRRDHRVRAWAASPRCSTTCC